MDTQFLEDSSDLVGKVPIVLASDLNLEGWEKNFKCRRCRRIQGHNLLMVGRLLFYRNIFLVDS